MPAAKPCRGNKAGDGPAGRPTDAEHAPRLVDRFRGGHRGEPPLSRPSGPSTRRVPPDADEGLPRPPGPPPPPPRARPAAPAGRGRARQLSQRGSGPVRHRYLLPGAASPTRQPGLWGRRRLVPRLSHEAPGGPRFALPPQRPPALHPHPRRWSPGGRQRDSTFAALAAQEGAFLLRPAPSFSRDPSSPRETPSGS